MRTHARPRRLLAAALVPLVIAASITACSARDDDAASASPGALRVDPDSAYGLPELIGLEPIVQPETVVLEADDSPVDSLTLLNADECAPTADRVPCEFRVTFAEVPEGVKVGSVLVSDVTAALPDGMLVKVTSLDGNEALATEATLGDAIEQGEFLVEQQFTAADVRAIHLAPGVTALGETALASASLGSQGAGVPRPVGPASLRVFDDSSRLAQGDGGGLAFGFSIDHKEIVDGVYADGAVGFDVGCGAYGGLTWETYFGVPVYPNGAYFEASCGATQDGNITITAEKELTLDEIYEIASVDLDAITFFVGPVPVVLVPTITVYATASGTVKAEMSFGASEHFGAKAGIKYNDGFSLIKDFSFDFDSNATNLDARLSAKAGVQVSEGLMLYGLVGPRLTQTIYAEITAKPEGERPIWCMEGGIEAGVELHIDLGIKELNYGPEVLYEKSFELGCASNIPPTIHMATSATTYTVYPASTFQPPTVTAISDDVEEGSVPITWSEGGTVLGTSQSFEPFSLSMLSLGTHTITATATDSDGGTASTSITVVAKEAIPTIRILAQDSSGNFVDASTLTGTTGGQAIVRIESSTPLGIQVGSCLGTSWSGGLAVASDAGCDYRISLSKAGTYALTATATDPDGKTVSDTITVTVKDPAPGSPPSFTPIAGINLSLNPQQSLCDGCAVSWGEQVRLSTSYTNSAQAGKQVTYVWEVRKSTSQSAGTWTTLTGSDGTPASGSSRTWTAPAEYKNQYTFTFRVTAKDATSGATYYTDTFVLYYSGPPA